MKKICLVTWYNSVNYGTCLQCYALSKYLKDKNYEVFVPENFKYYYGIKHPVETIRNIIKKIVNKVDRNEEFEEKFSERKKNNTRFAYENNCIYRISSAKDYKKMLRDANVFLTGSDQIWNPNIVSTPFLLGFVPKKNNCKRIAYGSSLGIESMSDRMEKKYKKYLSLFDYIGVREDSAKRLLDSFLEKKVYRVVDPVYLLEKKEWEALAEKSKARDKYVLNEKYALTYFIGKNDAWFEELTKTTNLRCINIVSESMLSPEGIDSVYDCSVEDFIYLINNAEFVVTDSFHAVSLSIILKKNFAVYKRFRDDDKKSQNSRIVDVLKMFKLDNRMVDGENILKQIFNTNIDYARVSNILNDKIKESGEYLLNAIELN